MPQKVLITAVLNIGYNFSVPVFLPYHFALFIHLYKYKLCFVELLLKAYEPPFIQKSQPDKHCSTQFDESSSMFFLYEASTQHYLYTNFIIDVSVVIAEWYS